MSENRRRVLVAGGAGFIGFNLIRELICRGYSVVCLDDFSSGTRQHVETMRSIGNIHVVRHDVVEPIDFDPDVEMIFNLACPASPPFYQRDPIKTLFTSISGVRNLLDLARSTGARLVHASTSEIYGDPLEHPQTESYCGNVKTMGPRACYDEGKRCAETLIYDYARLYGVDARVARIFNTYGPGMRADDGRVVSNFVVQALRGEDVTIYGDGRHTRSMCYVDDLVDGLLRMAEHDGLGCDPVNLGNPHEITVGDFARMVVAATGSTSRIVYLPDAPDDPHLRRPDITRALVRLGWRPTTSLEDGLRQTIAYFAELIAEAPSARSHAGALAAHAS